MCRIARPQGCLSQSVRDSRQVLEIRKSDDQAGCHPHSGSCWTVKFHNIYAEGRAANFADVHHFNIVADGAVHSKQDSIVSLIWCWEKMKGAYGDVQWINTTKHLTPDTIEMTDEIERYGLAGWSAVARPP